MSNFSTVFDHLPYRWCVVNVPIMYSRSCELAGPYLQLVVEKTVVVWGYCWGALETAAAYIPVAKEKVNKSFYLGIDNEGERTRYHMYKGHDNDFYDSYKKCSHHFHCFP